MSDQGLGNTASVHSTLGPDIDSDPFAPTAETTQDREYYRDPDTGQWAPKPNPVGLHLVTKTIPITEQATMTTESFTPETSVEEATRFARWLQFAANQIVDASALRKDVEELRKVVQELKNDVEIYRETNARLDEEVTRLRAERVDLQRENGVLRAERDDERDAHRVTADKLAATQRDSDHWQQSYIQLSTEVDTTRRERDDAQIKVMELEDRIKAITADNERLERTRTDLASKLSNARLALAA